MAFPLPFYSYPQWRCWKMLAIFQRVFTNERVRSAHFGPRKMSVRYFFGRCLDAQISVAWDIFFHKDNYSFGFLQTQVPKDPSWPPVYNLMAFILCYKQFLLERNLDCKTRNTVIIFVLRFESRLISVILKQKFNLNL